MQLTPTHLCAPTLTFHCQAQAPNNTGYCSTIQFTAVNYSSAFSCSNCMFTSNRASDGSAVAAFKDSSTTRAIDLTGSKFSGVGLQGLWRCRLTIGQGATRDTAAHAPSLAAGPPEAGGLGDAEVEGCRVGSFRNSNSYCEAPRRFTATLPALPAFPNSRGMTPLWP